MHLSNIPSFRPQLIWGAAIVLAGIVLVVAVYAGKVSSDRFGQDPAAWGQLGDYLGGILNPLLALTNIAIFCWLTLTLRALQFQSESASSREKAVDRTISLHKDYYESDFYERVRSPAHQVTLKWKLLPDEERIKYRMEVASGWTDWDSVEKATKYLNPCETTRVVNDVQHFWTRLPIEGLTEHQAISIYVRTWGRLWQLYRLGVLDHDLFIALFSDLYSYEREFFSELSDKVLEEMSKGKSVPGWIPALKQLDALFQNGISREAQPGAQPRSLRSLDAAR